MEAHDFTQYAGSDRIHEFQKILDSKKYTTDFLASEIGLTIPNLDKILKAKGKDVKFLDDLTYKLFVTPVACRQIFNVAYEWLFSLPIAKLVRATHRCAEYVQPTLQGQRCSDDAQAWLKENMDWLKGTVEYNYIRLLYGEYFVTGKVTVTEGENVATLPERTFFSGVEIQPNIIALKNNLESYLNYSREPGTPLNTFSKDWIYRRSDVWIETDRIVVENTPTYSDATIARDGWLRLQPGIESYRFYGDNLHVFLKRYPFQWKPMDLEGYRHFCMGYLGKDHRGGDYNREDGSYSITLKHVNRRKFDALVNHLSICGKVDAKYCGHYLSDSREVTGELKIKLKEIETE